MERYVDLTHTIEEGLPAHPYDEKMKLQQSRFLHKDGFNDARLETGMHTGTHIDVPSHLTTHDGMISDYGPGRFIGRGCLLDVRGLSVIGMKDDFRDLVKEDDIVLLYTGHAKHFGEASYFTGHPVMAKELAEFLAERKVKMVGMDLPSPDASPFDIHKFLLKKDILIIENLTNLEALTHVQSFEVMALPLRIKAQGSPARVVARITSSDME